MIDFAHLHVHTEYSLLDGAIRIKNLFKAIKEKNMHAVAITDHGNMFGTIAFAKAAKKFYNENIKNGLSESEAKIKIIIGCEMYICDDMFAKNQQSENNHITLLCKNKIGYKNLIKLNTLAYTQGFYYKPRIDLNLLKQHSEGIICLSGCLKGKISQLLLKNEYNKAKQIVLDLKSVFNDDYYIEIQNHGLTEQIYIFDKLIKLSQDTNVELVATNDAHYINKEDYKIQDILECINTKSTLFDQYRFHLNGAEYYLKTPEEMMQIFNKIPQSISNTIKIVNKCEENIFNINDKYEIVYSEKLFPSYIPPNNKSASQYLRELGEDGLKKRYKNITQEIQDRFELEFQIICKMGYAEYYLIVWDFVAYAKKNDILVGVGRGSGVSSILAYSLGITNIDPLKYGLLFERFLNVERVSMPDFDIDFQDDRRDEIIEYVKNKYGENNVAQIITFGTLSSKMAIKDVGRVYKIDFATMNNITKLMNNKENIKNNFVINDIGENTIIELPEYDKNNVCKPQEYVNVEQNLFKQFVSNTQNTNNIPKDNQYVKNNINNAQLESVKDKTDKILNDNAKLESKQGKADNILDIDNDNILTDEQKELNKIYSGNDDYNKKIREIVNVALRLEDIPRHIGIHAAGVVICNDVITNHIPLCYNNESISTQFDMRDIEELGMLKMDFLGLRTLTDIKKTLDSIRNQTGEEINFDELEMNDKEVFKMISDGETVGVFQLESGGMQQFMKQLRPNTFEDIIAGISLYRPGPMDEIKKFVQYKHSENIQYKHRLLEPILKSTYGVIVYQEQVMQICQRLAGFSLGQADIVRRAMGKKKLDIMAKQKELFIYGGYTDNGAKIIGAVNNGISVDVAKSIFDQMYEFAKYAFNKSHATAYAAITYQTAYLKHYYLLDYFCSILNNRISDIDECSKYLRYLKNIKIKILGPSINKSDVFFIKENDSIRFGISAIKNIGIELIKIILNERYNNGSFKSFEDFIARTTKFRINKKVVENMIYAGCFDELQYDRHFLLSICEKYMNDVMIYSRNKISNQLSFFNDISYTYPSLPNINVIPFSNKEKLEYEKNVIGMYVSSHPLDEYRDKYDAYVFHTSIQNNYYEKEDGTKIFNIFQQKKQDQKIHLMGIISNINIKITKSNKYICFVTLEDFEGEIEIILFHGQYEDYKTSIKIGNIVDVLVDVASKDGELKCKCEKIELI